MWLLNVRSYRLEWIHHRAAAEMGYAILSHTWADEEVSFQDMQNLEVARHLRGFQKIELTCEQAQSEGLSYVWVDTCCIDKKSSAELSEAINSMFNYYARSNCCYVFLADADVDAARAKCLPDLHTTPAWLASSRWFTRGWTLQELLAPSCVKFFSRQWEYIGTRSTLAAFLADITGIAERMLRKSSSLADYTIAQRMSWAAGRKTTREEDRAYSLMGLFGVNMPLLYGEGSRAFERLQREIIKDTDDQSLFLWEKTYDAFLGDPPEHLAYSNVLAASPDNFKNAGRIIAYQSVRNRPFEFTNSGLRITVPIVAHDVHKYLVFNCRYSDDFRGPLAIQVNPSSPGLFAQPSHGGEHHQYELDRFIVVIPIESLTAADMQPTTCLLIKTRTDFGQMRRDIGGPIVCSFWFRGLETCAEYLEDVHPVAHWNGPASVMQWTREVKGPERGYWGYISWKFQHESGHQCFMNLFLQVAIRAGKFPHYCISTMRTHEQLCEDDFDEWSAIAPVPTEEVAIYDLDEMLCPRGSSNPKDESNTINTSRMLIEGHGSLQLSAEMQQLFGNRVCVVDVSFESSASAPSKEGSELFFDKEHITSASEVPRKRRRRTRRSRDKGLAVIEDTAIYGGPRWSTPE